VEVTNSNMKQQRNPYILNQLYANLGVNLSMTKKYCKSDCFVGGIIACLIDRKWMCYEASGDVMMVEFEV
jgi:hypothetical protein